MKKPLSIIAVFLLVLSVSTASAADLPSLFEQSVNLLFHTDDVMIKLDGTMTLDGEPFKLLTITHAQKDGDFYREIRQDTISPLGESAQTGYAILGIGDTQTSVDCYGKCVVYGYRLPKHSVLKQSVWMNTAVNLLRSIVHATANALPADAVTQDGTVTRINLAGDQAPDMYHTALTWLLNLWGDEARYLEYSDMPLTFMGDIADFTTYMEGILYCTREVRLLQADLTITTDDEGRITQISGSIELQLSTAADTAHVFTCEGTVNVSAYGQTILPDESVILTSPWPLE